MTDAVRLLTPEQAAMYLGLPSRWSIYRLVKSGQLAAVPLAGKLRLDRADLDRLIEALKGAGGERAALQLAPVPHAAAGHRTRLAPLARRPRAGGDRTVTRGAEAHAAASDSRRRPDISSVRPATKEGR